MKNPAHLANFKTAAPRRFAVVDVTGEWFRPGKVEFEISSGRTPEEAKERFYRRFLARLTDQELMLTAQRNNRLKLVRVEPGARHLVEDRLQLIAAM